MTAPSTVALERAALTALPAPRVAFDGPFVIRAFLGGTGRANSASSLCAAPDPGLADRVARIEARYGHLGLVPRFRSTPLDPAGLAPLLRARGYAEEDETVILVAPVAPLAAFDAEVVARDGPDEDWIGVIATAEYQGEARRAEKLATPALLAASGAWLTLRREGVAAASLSVVADGRIAGFFDLAVHPDLRRHGLARRIVRAGAHWARSQGSEWLFAQVAAANAASRALCAGLGMAESYRYRYFVPRDSSPAGSHAN